jgi:thioredoxin reductase (NADPH)
MDSFLYDLIIIGAGPAGLTAGLYAGRYRLKTLILEKMVIGGQILSSPTIENFPGFPGGISTQELIERLKKQIDDLGINIEIEEVLAIIASADLKNPIYKIRTENKVYETKSIIIAVGAQPKSLGVKGEDKLVGRGISYCGTCDGPLFRDKEIVVVGGGDRAIEEAIFLSNYAKRVTLIHRRNQLRASKILEEKIRQNPKINFILESIVEEIIGEEKVEAIKIKDLKTNSISTFPCQGIFIFVGIKPNTDFLKNQLALDEVGFIITDEDLKTSCAGIFACGDCRKKSLYQVITACSEGAVAAASCLRGIYYEKNNFHNF